MSAFDLEICLYINMKSKFTVWEVATQGIFFLIFAPRFLEDTAIMPIFELDIYVLVIMNWMVQYLLTNCGTRDTKTPSECTFYQFSTKQNKLQFEIDWDMNTKLFPVIEHTQRNKLHYQYQSTMGNPGGQLSTDTFWLFLNIPKGHVNT